MSIRILSFSVALIAAVFVTQMANQAQPTERQPDGQNAPETPIEAGSCLEKPKHWSEKPPATPGTTILMSRFIRFQTPDGPMIPARVFLIESNPRQIQMPPGMPPDVIDRTKKLPIRFIGFGWEIEDDPDFQPDFEISARDVRARQPCTYEVSAHDVKFLVQVVGTP